MGRDTSQLQPKQINRAVVETIAENTVDGIIAPLVLPVSRRCPVGDGVQSGEHPDSMVGYKMKSTALSGWSVHDWMMSRI